MGYYVGFDLGGENIRTVLSDREGNFVTDIIQEKNDKNNGALGISRQMRDMLGQCIDENGVSFESIVAGGISSAGPLDLKKFGGSIFNSTNIKLSDAEEVDIDNLPDNYVYRGNPLIEKVDGKKDERNIWIPLVDPVKDFLKKPVYLGNDVNTAVIGVVMFGEGSEYGNPRDMDYTGVATTHGRGFGAGVWARGGVLEGVDGNAAECGHYKVVDEGIKCGCGNKGCAETFGSGTGTASNAVAKIIENDYKSKVYEKAFEKVYPKGPKLLNQLMAGGPGIVLNKIDSKLVFDTFREFPNDKVAREVVEEAGKYIGRAYGMIACSYNPYFIATFGSVTNDWDLLEKSVLAEMKESCNVRIPDVFVTKLGADVGLYGAIGRAIGYGK